MVKSRKTIMILKYEVNEMAKQIETAKHDMLQDRKKLKINVHTRVHPGVECIIYGDRYQVSAERGRCTIKFDEANIIFA